MQKNPFTYLKVIIYKKNYRFHCWLLHEFLKDSLVLLWEGTCTLWGTFPLQLLFLRDSFLSLNGVTERCPGVGEGVSDRMAEQAAAAPLHCSISKCHMSGSWTNNAPLSTLTKLGVWPCEVAEHSSLRNCAHTHTPVPCAVSHW